MIKRYSTTPTDILDGRWPKETGEDSELTQYVSEILNDIRLNGVKAILEYTGRFDLVELDPDEIKVTSGEIEGAYNKVTTEQIDAITESKERLEKVETKRLSQQDFNVNLNEVEIKCTTRPLSRVGCYVPGGKGAYPSTLIMNVVPAKVAGVNEVMVCSPPGKDGGISPILLVAADVCGVDEIYKLGGVQAIAAMAYGVPPLKKPDKIVGPGNRYVTEAKKQVSGTVAIDKPAGPSEILIIADGSGDPRIISLDLISQAEHGPGGISGLVTTSRKLADDVEKEMERLLSGIPRRAMVTQVLGEGCFIYVVDSLEEALRFVNEFAPEHLEVLLDKPEKIVKRISNAGLILLGSDTPVSSTDYCMGVNHVLPTEGYAKISSGLNVLDFVKLVSIISSDKQGLRAIKNHVRVMAQAEGLLNHFLALEGRLE